VDYYREEQNTNIITIPYSLFLDYSDNDVAYLEAQKYGDNRWTARAKITVLKDGADGKDAYMVIITSSNGDVFTNGNVSTELIAKVFKGGVEVDLEGNEYTYSWKCIENGKETDWTYDKKKLDINSDDVNIRRTYTCEVSKGGT
jgi:hypothetical protein